MKLVIFGLSVSSSWGNGHATLWRGLIRALAANGHRIVFYERDVPYYAAHRDLTAMPGATLRLYSNWDDVRRQARADLHGADAAIVTSYCPDGIAASESILASAVRLRVFYDLDTPVTLTRIQQGEPVPYIGPRGLADFDLVLSYTGGAAADALRDRLGARRVAMLYGSVDTAVHRRVPAVPHYVGDLTYLGTYAEDRQEGLRRFFLDPARRLERRRFIMGGAQYPTAFPWSENIYFVRHLPPAEHPAFYSSSRLTLNVTRGPMAQMGHCPSGRLFEAAACGTPVVSDAWDGLEEFFEPGREILVARDTEDVMAAIELSDRELATIGAAARTRVLSDHTAERRAAELVDLLDQATVSAVGA